MKKNILFITVDQMREDSWGRGGNTVVKTPYLDRLAGDGVHFSNAQSNSPVCIPSRTSMITGKAAHRNGCPRYEETFRVDRDPSLFLGSLITEAGYQTELIGKTHWHTEESFRAGFEHVVSSEHRGNLFFRERSKYLSSGTTGHGGGGNEFTPHLSVLPPHMNSTAWKTDRAIEFLEERDPTVPFMLWLSHTEPHPPFAIHEPFYSMYDGYDMPDPVMPDWLDRLEPQSERRKRLQYDALYTAERKRLDKVKAVYYGMITNIDNQIGRIIHYLEEHDLYDDTWIIFLSDHGEKLGDYGGFSKTSLLRSSANVPLIIKPAKDFSCSKDRDTDEIADVADILPTLCDIAGARVPEDVDGISLLPVLEGKGEGRAFLHGNIDTSHMILTPEWKYLYYTENGEELLFDMKNDKFETHDLTAERPEILKELRELLLSHLIEENHPDAAGGVLRNDGKVPPAEADVKRTRLVNIGVRRGTATVNW